MEALNNTVEWAQGEVRRTEELVTGTCPVEEGS